MADPIDTAGEAPSTTATLPEVAVAVAAVLSRCCGTDRATLSSDHPAWRHELALPRASSSRDALAAWGTPPIDRVTVTVTDEAGRRRSATVQRSKASERTTWASDDPADGETDGRIARVLRRSLVEPDTALSALPILTESELDAHAALARPVRSTPGVNVIAELQRHAKARPAGLAIVDGGSSVSYADLHSRVADCAASLAARGLAPGDVVALILPRSTHLIVAIMGALRAGITFTVINPATPIARTRRLIQDAGARLVVAEHALDLPVAVVVPSRLTGAGRRVEPASDDPARTAYVLFTSGSTGQPKGVAISCAALWRHVEAVIPAYELSSRDRVLQLAEPGFDVLLEELLPTIAVGARVVIAEPSWLDSQHDFLAYLRQHAVTVLNVPSSLWVTLLQRDGSDDFAAVPDRVRLVVVGSERVPASAYLSWRRCAPARARLLNAYGTTETTITSLVYAPEGRSLDTVRRLGAVPIGTPLANTVAQVVDRFGDPCPFGLPGELVIGGASVFSGYVGAGTPPATTHHTGDLVYLDHSGVVVHIGRLDGQLKVRGHRIEPAEVEAALEAMPAVRRALCTSIAEVHDSRLVAVVVPTSTIEPSSVLAELRTVLPGWLVPDQLLVSATLPVNAHGKVDRAAVRRLANDAPPKAATMALTDTERVVATCVADMLGCPIPAAGDNFYALGGTSLQAIRLVVRLARQIGVALSARQVLQDPTIAAIARAVENARSGPATGLVRRERRESFPLTPNQAAMLRFLSEDSLSRPYFEMWEAFRIRGPLDHAALRRALLDTAEEHEPLRTVVDPTTMTQRVLTGWAPAIHHVDLTDTAAGDTVVGDTVEGHTVEGHTVVGDTVEGLSRVLEDARRPFDLRLEPAFRPVIIRVGPQEHVLSLTFHHLFFDGWSYGLLHERLADLYTAHAAGVAPPRRPARPQFGDYALHLAHEATAEARQRDIAYWRSVLGGHQAPEICTRIMASDASSSAAKHTVDRQTSKALESLAASAALTPFALLKATFVMVLSHVLRHPDLLVASNDANRYQAGTEDIVGYLATSLLSRFQLRGEDSFLKIAGHAQGALTSARLHTSVQWEDLVSELGLGNAVQFRFSLQDTPSAPSLRLPGLDVETMPDAVLRRGKRAVAVVAWRRPRGYELQWYARDDAVVVAPRLALTLFDTVLARAVADPHLTLAQVARRLSADRDER